MNATSPPLPLCLVTLTLSNWNFLSSSPTHPLCLYPRLSRMSGVCKCSVFPTSQTPHLPCVASSLLNFNALTSHSQTMGIVVFRCYYNLSSFCLSCLSPFWAQIPLAVSAPVLPVFCGMCGRISARVLQHLLDSAQTFLNCLTVPKECKPTPV
jgi:hypothetical protein